MFSLCHCYIDHHALAHNVRQLGDIASLMPVIKSNAYGHGLLPVAHTLNQQGARYFAVGTVNEALRLRLAGLQQEIVVLLGAATPEAMAAAHAHNVVTLVHSVDSLRRAAACGSPEHPVRVVLKQNTGMNRLGFTLDEMPALRELLRTLPQVSVCMLFSHLSCADVPERHASALAQAEDFQRMRTALQADYPQMKACLNNTAGIVGFPQWAHDLSRPGIALYGYNPFAGTSYAQAGPDLRPVMSVSTRILQIRAIAAGTPVSYGATWTSPTATRVAVLGIGYADGFSRGLSSSEKGAGQVMIAGRRVPIVGRVCMGMCMVDVGTIAEKDVHEGDAAWILGGPASAGLADPADPANTANTANAACLSAEDLAAAWGTISYEVLCLLGNNSHVDNLLY